MEAKLLLTGLSLAGHLNPSPVAVTTHKILATTPGRWDSLVSVALVSVALYWEAQGGAYSN